MQNTEFEAKESHNTVDIAEQIEASNLSAAMKKNMRLVHTHLQSIQFGMPQYDLKGTQIWPTMSNFAFIFSIFYYLAKGLWRKAIVLLVIGVAVNIIVVLISALLNIELQFPLNCLGALLTSFIAMQSAYSDIYRHQFLKQVFWW